MISSPTRSQSNATVEVDFLIVGQGIVGTTLACKLLSNKYSVLIIDKDHPNSASRLACGIINPVTGRRFVKTWKYDELEISFRSFYQEVEKILKTPVLENHEILLALTNVKEENDLLSQSFRYGYESSLTPVQERDFVQPDIPIVYSLKSYRLNVQSYLLLFREKWTAGNIQIDEKFEYDHLSASDGLWTYKDILAKHIIFCEGAAVKENPYFKEMPIIPNKGQGLWIHTPDFESYRTLKHQVMISGYGQRHWVGASFEWSFDDQNPTEAGYIELGRLLTKTINIPYEVTGRFAGIRPTVQDRRPILQEHPQNKNMWMINGMGSKGCSLSPYISDYFIHLIHNPNDENQFSAMRLFK